MENRKIRVAITQGDTNGIGYELIFKTFAEPEMLELCTPIVYGSPKVAAYHRNALNMQANFTIISNADEAKEDKLNIITTFDEEVKIDLGLECAEGGKIAGWVGKDSGKCVRGFGIQTMPRPRVMLHAEVEQHAAFQRSS